MALVGYTNAGKSTLMNTLCGSHQAADEGPFTTLDTKVKRLVLPNNQRVLISDTVGFIYNLPHHLIEAFKATLEEVLWADLLLHIVDISSEMYEEKQQAVYEILKQLGVERKSTLLIFNKIDKLDNKSLIMKRNFEDYISISAKERKNINSLLEKMVLKLSSELQNIKIIIPHTKMALLNIIHKSGHIQKEEFRTDGVYIEAWLPVIQAKKILTKLNCMLS